MSLKKLSIETLKNYRPVNILYPPRCVFCEALMPEAELQICEDCERLLQEHPPVRTGDFYGSCISVLPYNDLVRSSVLRLKMASKRSYAVTFGKLMAKQIEDRLAGQYDLITWVPVAGLRRLKRGFDQDELIARSIARTLHMPMKKLLRKQRQNRAQSSIHDAAQRRSNVANVFQPVHRQSIVGKRILLIDDVITTGATLSECSRVLLLAGAQKVVCATYAAANRKQ